MRKLILALLLLGLAAPEVRAQQEFANLEIPLRRAEDLVSVADGDGNVCLYFFQGGKLYFNLINPSGQLVAAQEIPYRWNQQPQILGTRVTETEFIFYSRFMNGNKDFVRPFAVNRYSGAFRSMPDAPIKKDRGETFVGSFADAGHFYMIFTDKKDNLHLYRELDETYYEKKSFSTADMPRTRRRGERQNELIFVHPDLERTVFAGHHRSKIYTQGDKIHLVFDGFYLRGQGKKTTTEILTLDWPSGQTTYRTLPALDLKSEPHFNSFLHQDKLFRVQLQKDQFNLTAFDFSTLQPIKEYNYTGDQEIAIKSTPVHQRGASTLFSSGNNVIEKTSKVMRNLSSGMPAITVDAFGDSTLQLTIGSYQPPSTRSSPDPTRLVRTPDRYIQTSRGLFLMPGRWVPAYTLPYSHSMFPYNNYYYDPYFNRQGMPTGPGISTYFRTVLDSETLDKAASDSTATTVQDKIEAYEEELKQTPDFKTLYRYGTDKLHYGYFDRRTKTFKILEFTQK
ncbi:hypothetical protein [Pontibacter roseus]|uniref:hypothetical protein n=1 Tax=Pontibacter roseus TaxID=336989 RepID=UPI000361573B|nr:hypothetical protein [Pontibacter roseus]